MRPIVLTITLLGLSLATQQSQTALAQNDQASPDFDLAYVLATASYCAYAVGQADADRGQKRAFQCLSVAAQKDAKQLLGVFQDIGQDKVEAYFDPNAPENAYLLIQNSNRGHPRIPRNLDAANFTVGRPLSCSCRGCHRKIQRTRGNAPRNVHRRLEK